MSADTNTAVPALSRGAVADIWPAQADGQLRVNRRTEGRLCSMSATEIDLALHTPPSRAFPSALIGLPGGADGRSRCAGIEITDHYTTDDGRARITGRFAGRIHDVVSSQWLLPDFDPTTMAYRLPVDPAVMRTWQAAKIYEPVLLDRVAGCPRCGCVPTFRSGCGRCRSGRTDPIKLIHHYACAHVGSVKEYEAEGSLICPKCRTRDPMVGTDYEYLTTHRCRDCGWEESQLASVGHCLACDERFAGNAAQQIVLVGYRRCVDRLDPLAHVTES